MYSSPITFFVQIRIPDTVYILISTDRSALTYILPFSPDIVTTVSCLSSIPEVTVNLATTSVALVTVN